VRTRNWLATVAIATGIVVGDGSSALAASCQSTVGPGDIASAETLRAWNATEYGFGHPRPTGSSAQRKFVDWLEQRARRTPGVRVSTLRYRISRWDATDVSLAQDGARIPVAGPVPYSHGTARSGVTAPLTVVEPDRQIDAANAGGRIVIRQADAGAVPYSVFLPGALGTWMWDPDGVIEPAASFRGDFLTYNARVRDLRDAKAAGAAGVVFVKPLPRGQIKDHYEPYEGTRWGVPALFVGADEGKRLTDAVAAGGAPTATIRLRARVTPTTTRTLLATLPGRSRQKIVVDSHTDGTSAVEDNGPVAMLAMMRYLARRPERCRARTVQFAFTTAHFYQRLTSPTRRHGGAGDLARRLDREYDKRRVAGVVVLEHLGARHYETVPRTDGPGGSRRLTRDPELLLVPVTPSPGLVRAVRKVVMRRRLGPTALLVGADAEDPDRAPRHCSFGGQGTPYNERLLPTVAPIAAPEPLYDGGSGLEGVDFGLMRAQTEAFTDLVLQMQTMTRVQIAGDVTRFRAERRRGVPGCKTEL
jgi:hypothetical protein